MGLAPYDNAIQAIATMFGKVADVFTTKKEHQLETDLLSDDKKKNKALIIANELFDLINESNGYITDRDMKLIERMRKKFDELIIN